MSSSPCLSCVVNLPLKIDWRCPEKETHSHTFRLLVGDLSLESSVGGSVGLLNTVYLCLVYPQEFILTCLSSLNTDLSFAYQKTNPTCPLNGQWLIERLSGKQKIFIDSAAWANYVDLWNHSVTTLGLRSWVVIPEAQCCTLKLLRAHLQGRVKPMRQSSDV